MSYNYQTERHKIFTEDGQILFLQIRDNANRLIDQAGAAMMDKIIAGCSGDSWQMLACVDRLVELRELVEITQSGGWGQNRVFVRKPS